jgi:diguanylate cyclase (GGDEF)-like protein
MRPVFVSSLMANDTFLKDWTLNGEGEKGKIQKYLLEIMERYGFFSTFFVSDISGNYYHFSGILKQISKKDGHDIWYYRFIDSGKDYTVDVDTDEASQGTLTIFINHRLQDYNGNLLGVTGVGLKMEAVSKILSEYRIKYRRNIYLVDATGLVQVHSDRSLIAKENLHNMGGISKHAQAILNQEDHKDVYEYEQNNSHILLTARYIPELNWFLIVEQDQNEALQTIKNNLFRNMLFAAIVILVVIGINIFTVNHYQNKLVKVAVTDKLTGAFNRRELDFTFEKTLKVAVRQQSALCAILIDLDYFKNINDIHGHIVGDLVLKQVVELINQGMRGNDLLVRWGGDELMALTPCSLEVATRMAERLRMEIENKNFNSEDDPIRLTISCGVAEFLEGDSIDTLTRRCDEALYLAKGNGRNRVEVSVGR